jgi:hypothetical protein
MEKQVGIVKPLLDLKYYSMIYYECITKKYEAEAQRFVTIEPVTLK